MALTRVICPECGAGVKSRSGFAVGETVTCPKCEAEFAVEEPEEADAVPSRAADDRPRRKRRRDDDEDDDGGRSYKNSPLRYAVLGVLVIVMVVLGVMLYLKKKRERDQEQANAAAANADAAPADPNPRRGPVGPMVGGPMVGGPMPGGPMFPMGPNPPGKFPMGGGPVAGRPGGPGFGPPPGFGPTPEAVTGGLFETPRPGTPQAQQLTGELSKKLAGTWTGTAPDGTAHEVVYRADGTFTHTAGSNPSSGTWRVDGLLGTRGLKVNRGGPAPARVVFEDDELLHDTGKPGETVVLRKK